MKPMVRYRRQTRRIKLPMQAARARQQMHNFHDWKFASPPSLCPGNYRDAYYAQSFVTAVIIRQDNELVNNESVRDGRGRRC